MRSLMAVVSVHSGFLRKSLRNEVSMRISQICSLSIITAEKVLAKHYSSTSLKSAKLKGLVYYSSTHQTMDFLSTK